MACPGCADGACVLHASLFAELRDELPSIPATQAPRVYRTPPALPWRRRPRLSRAALEARLAELEHVADAAP